MALLGVRGGASWGWRIALGALMVGSVSATAAAQSVDSGRAFRGLFAPNVTGGSAALTTEVYQGSNRGTAGSTLGGGSVYDRGTFTGLTSGLTLGHAGRRTTYGANALGMLRYYNDTGSFRSLYQGGAIGVRHEGRRVAVELQEQVSQEAAFEFGNLRRLGTRALGSLGAVAPDHALEGYGLFTAASTVGVGFQTGRRQWVSLGYRYAYIRLSQDDELLPPAPASTFHSQDVSLRTSQQFWKNTGVEFEFNALRGGLQQVGTAASTWVYTFNTSVDRMQSLSLTRTTTLRAGAGASVLHDARGQRLVFTGAASLDKQVNRGMRASLGFQRDVHFVEGLPDPVLTNGMVVVLTAQPVSRVHLGARAIGSRGQAALGSDGATDVPYTSYGLDARLRVRLAGPLAAYGEYVNFHQQFDDGGSMLVLRGPVERQGFRAGILFVVPLSGQHQRGVE
jgi:hypothetical protein